MRPAFALLVIGCAGFANAWAATSSVWEMTSFSDFVKGTFDGVSLGRDGRLTLAPKLNTLFTSDQPVVWSVVAGPDGALYAGTGNRGRVFRIEANGTAKVLWTADRPEVFALVVDTHGVVYAASSPDGKIYRIENGKATEYFDPKTKYIWSLALAPDGTLYAGTGDDGRIFRITAAGRGEEYYATRQANVTSLMLDKQGRLLAGTEPNGILYRVTAKDKAFALYDSNLPEIRAFAPNADGSIYAVALGGAVAKKSQVAQQSAAAAADTTAVTTITVTADASRGAQAELKPVQPERPKEATPAATPSVSTATTTTTDNTNVEKSAIYRINPDNTVDTLWSSKEENVYDVLPWTDGQIYFGTDENGRIYRLSADRKLTMVVQTNESEAVRLLDWKGALLAATSNMGKIYSLNSATANPQGTYESPVFDAGSVAKWGKVRWQSDGGTATMRTRSGNSTRPDRTWSDWSSDLRDSSGSQISSPNARYLQYEARLTGPGAAIGGVSAAYLPQNNPPVIHSITVIATATPNSASANTGKSSGASASYSTAVTDTGDATPNSSTGTPTQTLSRAASQQMVIGWTADDPDGDKLVYELDFRADGEPGWIPLRKDLHDTTYTIDGDALADGRYFFRVIASDREANVAAAARESDLISSPVLIDNTPPVLQIVSSTRTGSHVDIAFSAKDATSVLRRAEWSIDAGPWTPLAPLDGLLDSQAEEFRFAVDPVSAGEHLVVIRVADSGNNTGLAKVVLK